MDSKTVFNLRNEAKSLSGIEKLNKLNKALYTARNLYSEDSFDEWIQKAYSWVLIDLCKHHIEGRNLNQAATYFNEVNTIDFKGYEDEIIESIYDMLQEYPQISIDVEFPDNILIETFKSSVTNFLHFRYNFDASKKIPNYRVMSRKMNSIIKECPGIGRKIFVFKDGRKYTSFITLNGKSEPVLYVKPITKYTTIEDDISDDDTTEEGQIANESNTSLFAFDPEFSTRLDELIHVTDVHVRTNNLSDTDDYFDSDDEIEVNEDLYDP